MQKRWIELLQQYITPERQNRFQQILSERTRHLTIVLEDLYQAHNISACLRSCECFGVQDVHVIENEYRFEVIKDIALGSAQWLTIHRWHEAEHNTLACLQQLREQGYRLLGTSPRESSRSLEELELTDKTALVFGTEIAGMSSIAEENVDGFVHIPMVGFTESMNVSVAVATCVHHLTWRLRQEQSGWGLNEEEQQELLIEWMRKVIRKHWKGLDERILEQLGATS